MSKPSLPGGITSAQLVAALAGVLAPTPDAQKTKDVKIEHEGSAIRLPKEPYPMGPGEAAMHLQRLAELEEKIIAPNHIIKAYPFDGAVAFMKAMQEKFGWATPIPTPGWFGDNPPATISVETGTDSVLQVFWGRFALPGLEKGYLETSMHRNEDGEYFFKISGEIKKKFSRLVEELADLTNQIVRRESIYRGKALRMRVNKEGHVDMKAAPGFIAIDNKDPLILPDIVYDSVRANLFMPVEQSAACEAIGVPLKRGVILAGPPGTGKTLTANKLAQKCIEHGWTYILVPSCKSLSEVMLFANRYAPAVVFAEDIDRVTNGNRDAALDELLNTMDGVNTKTSKVMTVFTTNNLSSIERTVVRPGRIDAIIEFPAPDNSTIQKFMRHYGKGLIPESEDLVEAAELLNGTIPANVRECVERSKLYALVRGATPADMQISAHDLKVAANTMKAHIDFFHSKREKVVTPEEALGKAFVAALGSRASLEEAGKQAKIAAVESHQTAAAHGVAKTEAQDE